jgi:hypothetical protein
VIRWNVCVLILGHDGLRRMLRLVLGLFPKNLRDPAVAGFA